MDKVQLALSKYANPTTMRIIYVMLALLAMVMAGGAPDDAGGG